MVDYADSVGGIPLGWKEKKESMRNALIVVRSLESIERRSKTPNAKRATVL